MIGSITLALVGVSILIGVFSTNFGGGGNSLFCSTYGGVSDVFPGRDAPEPEGCNQESSNIDYKSVEFTSKNEFNLRLSSALISCLDDYKGYNLTDELCQGWNIDQLPEPSNETDLNNVLQDQGFCGNQISNSEYEYRTGSSCGSENQVYFETQNISAGDFAVITYNYSSGNEKVILR